MNIRPKNSILYAATGVRFSSANAGGANWRQQVFNNYRQHLLDQLAKYGEANDYGDWLNEMQHRHSQLWNAANRSGNWEDIAYENEDVGRYQQDYRGGLGNDGTYKRFGTIQLNSGDNYDFNQTGIKTNQATRYNILNPPSRTSGDFSRKGYNYKVDNYYSAITDDRRLLGRKGDWDENSQEYKDWIKQLNDRGWTMYLDESDQYYKLKRLGTPDSTQTNPNQNPQSPQNNPNQQNNPYSLSGNHNEKYGFDWEKISNGLNKALPQLLNTGRLIGNLNNNNRVYKEQLKGIRPNLLSPYYTHRQIVGDEATKQAYYNRAAQGESQASRAFTSDADRQMAYQMEAKRIGDELRAQGDLADNQEIRRTSDESNAHEWSNIQRATEVANANRASINNANALRHNLKAQKYSADWTSIDNYLMSLEYDAKKRLAEKEAKQRQLDLLTYQRNLENDEKLQRLSNEANQAWEKSTYSDPSLDPVVKEKLRKLKNYQYDLQIRHLQTAKRGTKITLKNNSYDDLLYKTSRDAAEHFVKMSKISSDALNRKEVKIQKLAAHPKNTRRKYQQGGVAPFTIYRPITFGGESQMSLEQSSSTSSNTSTKKDTSEKDKLDMIKELFKEIQGQGLPVDVNAVYQEFSSILNRVKAFGGEMSTDDIASMYLKAMSKVNNLKYSKGITDKARQVATEKDSLGEFAVDAMGNYVVQDKEGNISTASSLQEIQEKKLNPITNEQLLNLRAYHPDLVLGKGDTLIDNVISNGMGINKISAYIKSLASSLGSSESKIDGLTKVESDKVKSGLEILAGAPDGHYKITTETKQQQEQVRAALAFIENSLTPSQKAILDIHGGTQQNIISALTSYTGQSKTVSIQPLTGKASSNSGENNDSKENDMIPAIAFFNGLGEKDTFIIQDKTSDGLKINTISAPITLKGSNTGSITFDKLQSSDFGGQLNMNQATMGDTLITPVGRQNIIIDGRIYQAELPIDQNAKNNEGVIEPDLRFLKRIEAADMEIKSKGIDKQDIKNVSKVNEIYKKHNLPVLYTISNNKLTITSNYARFAIVNGIGTEDAFGENPEFNDAIQEVSGDKERKQFEQLMQQQTNNSKYKLDDGFGIFGYNWGETKLYKGTIYIPMVNSNISALGGTGYKAKGEEYNQIEARQQAADAARNKGFVPAGDASNFK